MQKLREFLLDQVPPLKVKQDDENGFEVAGTKAVMQGKKKVDGSKPTKHLVHEVSLRK